MTCPPNVFRTGEALVNVDPGESFTGSWGISPRTSSHSCDDSGWESADARGPHPDRGRGDRRAEATADHSPRPARRRHRLARLDRDGIVDRAQQQRLRASRAPLTRLRPSGRRRLRLDDSPGRGHRGGRRRDLQARPAARPDPGIAVLSAALGVRARRPGLAVAFHAAADHAVENVLFSGQDALTALVTNPGAWSLSALASASPWPASGAVPSSPPSSSGPPPA
jgi:hypothetical protein